jgi:hypothetical protein
VVVVVLGGVLVELEDVVVGAGGFVVVRGGGVTDVLVGPGAGALPVDPVVGSLETGPWTAGSLDPSGDQLGLVAGLVLDRRSQVGKDTEPSGASTGAGATGWSTGDWLTGDGTVGSVGGPDVSSVGLTMITWIGASF